MDEMAAIILDGKKGCVKTLISGNGLHVFCQGI